MATFVLTDGDDLFPSAGEDISGGDLINALGGNDDVTAGAGDDVVNGGDGDDTARGGLGADLLNGDAGADTLLGGEGDDALVGGSEDDALRGEAGADTGQGGDGADRLWGGGGGDLLQGGEGDDSLWGGGGGDLLEAGPGRDVLRGGTGHDRLVLGTGRDRAFGEAGNDTFTLDDNGSGVVDGGDGFDTVLANITTELQFYGLRDVERLWVDGGIPGLYHAQGTVAQFAAFDRIIDTYEVSDITWLRLLAGGTVDFTEKVSKKINLTLQVSDDAAVDLTAGPGDDFLDSGGGDDTLDGGRGSDELRGGAGDDVLYGGPGVDTLRGGEGDDTIVFVDLNDVYILDSGVDTGMTDLRAFTMPADLERLEYTGRKGAALVGNAGIGGRGDNEIVGGRKGDEVSGGPDSVFNGDDLLRGLGGGDLLEGGQGNDTLEGGAGRDTLAGGDNDDALIGGAGRDVLVGGTGRDAFVFEDPGDSGAKAKARDRIADFEAGDVIDLSALDADLGTGRDDAFRLDAGGRFRAGEIRQTVSGEDVLLELNLDDDAKPEMTILVRSAGPLAEGDFVL